MTKRGCLLWVAMAGVALFFVWARVSLPLEELGTVSHLSSDGTIKENPIVTFGMIFVLCIFAVVTAVMLSRAEKKLVVAGDNADRAGMADPVAPATEAARSGCGTAVAAMGLIFVCGVLVWIGSMMTGGG